MVQGFLGGLLGSLLGRPGPLSFLLGVVGGVYLEQTYAIPDLRREAERCVPPPPGVPLFPPRQGAWPLPAPPPVRGGAPHAPGAPRSSAFPTRRRTLTGEADDDDDGDDRPQGPGGARGLGEGQPEAIGGGASRPHGSIGAQHTAQHGAIARRGPCLAGQGVAFPPRGRAESGPGPRP